MSQFTFDLPVHKASPQSDVLFMHVRGVLGRGNRRVNPRALTDDGLPLYARGLTVRAKFVDHVEPFDVPSLGSTKTLTIDRVFRPIADDGSWNESEISLYNDCCNTLLRQGTDFAEHNIKCSGSWSEAARLNARTRFLNFAKTFGFGIAADQEKYWAKGAKYPGNTSPSASRTSPIASPTNTNLNSDWAVPFDDATGEPPTNAVDPADTDETL